MRVHRTPRPRPRRQFRPPVSQSVSRISVVVPTGPGASKFVEETGTFSATARTGGSGSKAKRAAIRAQR